MIRCSTIMFLPILAAASSVSSQATHPAPASPDATFTAHTFNAAAKRAIVEKLSEALRDRYVFPDVGERAATRINAALAAGEYDSLVDRTGFIQRLSGDVQAIAHDKHLDIMVTSAMPPPRGPGAMPPPRGPGAMPPPRGPGGMPPPGGPGAMPPPGGPREMPRGEAGVTRADKLAGGIGYIEVVGFPQPRAFRPVLDRAMSGLKGSRALIIDVRRNGGGSPETVAYLVSYLVKPGQPINDIVTRVPKTKNFTRERQSSVPTPVSFAGVPVYVLTSKATFSGGEEFAYDVQALKRGTIIGEVTGGGANPTGPVDLGNGVMARIPFGRAENPVTKTNWEGRGVQPDLAVPAGNALKVALQKLGHKPAGEIETASLERVFAPRSMALPGYEPAIRQLIAGFISGQPDYSVMAPGFADETRSRLSQLRGDFTPLGELRSIKFRGPFMMGGDEFEIAFANGTRLMAIVLDPNGKIVAASPPMMVRPER